MNQGKPVFAQLMEYLRLTPFRCCVTRYQVEHIVRTCSCLDQLLLCENDDKAGLRAFLAKRIN